MSLKKNRASNSSSSSEGSKKPKTSAAQIRLQKGI